MTRHILTPNPKAKDEADPVYLVLTDTRATIGAIYHAYASWSFHDKAGRPLIEGRPSLRALRTAIRDYYAQESD